MSVIAIVVDGGSITPPSLMKLQKALGKSLKVLNEKIKNDCPIIEVELFEGDYQAHAKLIRSAIFILDEERVTSRFYEIPYGQTYASVSDAAIWEIDGGSVIAILDATDDEVDRQLEG